MIHILNILQIISKINLRKRYLCLDFTLSKNLNHYIMYSEAIRYNHFLKKNMDLTLIKYKQKFSLEYS